MPINLRNVANESNDELSEFLRPRVYVSFFCDAISAVAFFSIACWLRFGVARLSTFLPDAWLVIPWVVLGQLLGLTAAGAYTRRPRLDWFVWVVVGVVGGTASAAVGLALTKGLAGVSRVALVADAILLSNATIGWRGVWMLRARVRRRADRRPALNLVDRRGEVSSIGAVVRDLYRYRELLRNLVLKDLKLKYRGSVFGFLWSLVNPVLLILVYTVAFTFILRIRGERFVFYLMLGQLAWTFFVGSAMMSTGAIIDNAGLLKSVLFPRAVFPISTVLFNFAQYGLTILVFLPVMMLWYRVPFAAPMLIFPVIVALQLLFTIGVALMLATVTVFFRDVRHLLDVLLVVLFWTTPIVYELKQVPDALRLPILLSPMSPFVVAYQAVFYDRQWPEASIWTIAVFYALGSFITGTLFFIALDDKLTEQL